MPKLKGKAKAAFLARMARGRKKHARRPRRNPGGAATMPYALVVNPEPKMSKKRKSRSKKRRHTSKRRGHARKRRNVVVMNPRRGRRRRRNALVLNPGGVGNVIGSVAKTAIPAIGGGFLANFVDGKFLGSKSSIVRILGKVGLAAAVGVVGKRVAPQGAAAAMAGVLGTIGGDLGARAAGGLPAIPAQQATKAGLAAMAAEDDNVAALLEGMGIVVQGLGEGEDGIANDESGMTPGMAAYTDEDPSSYTGYGDMEID